MSKLSDKIYGLIFSEISLGLVVPVLLGLLILAFPTVIRDFLVSVKIYFPPYIFGGVQIPLEHILTVGAMEGLLTCSIPIIFGFFSNRWTGGSAGFLLSSLYVLAMAAYYGDWFDPTLEWLAVVVSGMLIGYITSALWTKFKHSGNADFKHMLLAALVPSAIAAILVTQTYIWYSPMFYVGPDQNAMDAIGLAWFTYIAIYGINAILGTFIAMLANSFARAYGFKEQ